MKIVYFPTIFQNLYETIFYFHSSYYLYSKNRLSLYFLVLISQPRSTYSQSNATKGYWITDGSVGFTVNEDVVSYVDKRGGDNVFNAMWQEGDGVSSGQHYWKIHFPTLVGGAGVGLTSRKHFRKGYACDTIKYLGNLSDGGGLLVFDFGPRPKQGDLIGILAVFEGDRLKVYIDVNNASLGLAFDVPASLFESIYPMVSFKESGSATCTKQMDIPNIKTRTPEKFTGIEGNWKLTRRNGGLKGSRTATTKIKKIDTDTYYWGVDVVNLHRYTLTKTNGNWKAIRDRSTKMGGDPASLAFEDSFMRSISHVTTFEIDVNGNLAIGSSTWTRYDATPEPYVGQPFP